MSEKKNSPQRENVTALIRRGDIIFSYNNRLEIPEGIINSQKKVTTIILVSYLVDYQVEFKGEG